MKKLALGFVLLVAARAFAVDVTACGQVVATRTTGVLTADLDCSSAAGAFAVDLADRATLQLAGHTISGRGVICRERCTVSGPGDITGAEPGLTLLGSRRVTVNGGISIHGNRDGIYGGARLTLIDVDVSNNMDSGVFTLGRQVKGSNVVINDNGAFGLFAQDAAVRLVGLIANDNGWFGVNAKRVRLLDSTLTGNEGGHPANPPFVDVVSSRRPRLVNTTCDHSLGPDGIVWGVCAQD